MNYQAVLIKQQTQQEISRRHNKIFSAHFLL